MLCYWCQCIVLKPISNASLCCIFRPYKGVIAEREIRRLKSQVLEKTKKQLTGKPRNRLDVSAEELLQDVDSDEEAARELSIPPHHRRPCQLHHQQQRLDEHNAFHASSSSNTLRDISTKKFLEVTLNTLESMGRQDLAGSGVSIGMGMSGQRSQSPNLRNGDSHIYSSNNNNNSNSNDHPHPSEAFLRGALWLGRNLTMITEEMWEELDEFRTKHLSEVASAVQDPDSRRSSHRLNLLAGSGINQALSMVTNGKKKARDILKVMICYDLPVFH